MSSIYSGDDRCVRTHDRDGNGEETDHRVKVDWSRLRIYSEILYIKVQDLEHDRGGGSLAVSLWIECWALVAGWSTCIIAAGSHGAGRAC